MSRFKNSSDPQSDANDLKVLNMQTKKLIRELIVMFEEKEFYIPISQRPWLIFPRLKRI